MIDMQTIEVKGKTRAIVCFGPMTDTAGMKAGSFFQVTVDPNLVSPGGDFIRFDNRAEDEIHGWQRIEGITICEVLHEEPPVDGIPPVTMRAVVKE